MKNDLLKNNQGVALILTIMLMTMVLFMSMYFLKFSLTENSISISQSMGAKTYYLAEAGIAEMVWLLKNDTTYKTNFEENNTWVESFVRNNPFGPDSGSYSVTITNSNFARGEIISVGSIDVGGGSSQRIVKTYVYKALSSVSIDTSSSTILTDNKIDVTLSRANIFGGSIHSNNDISLTGLSNIYVEEDLKAVDEFSKTTLSTFRVDGNVMDNHTYAPPPPSISMPPVSFDTIGDPNSFKARADNIYTEAEFNTFLNSASSPVTLNGITYVTGDIIFEGDPDIIINGVLVADGSITIGKVKWFWFVPICKNGEYTSISVSSNPGDPSGLIAKNDINIELCTEESDIEGVMYAADEIKIMDFAEDMNLTGSLIARNVNIISIWQPIDIFFEESILTDTLQVTEFSPVITVEHWEEEY